MLRDTINQILELWPTAINEPFKEHPLSDIFKDKFKSGVERIVFPLNPTLKVKASIGTGNWANIPWVSILDPEITKTTQDGVYPVYLFKSDGSGVYLSLNQGTTNPIKELGKKIAEARAVEIAKNVTKSISGLSNWGQREINLAATTTLGKTYETHNIIAKYYPANDIPSDEELRKDLEDVIEYYKESKLVWESMKENKANDRTQFVTSNNLSFSFSPFYKNVTDAHLRFETALVIRFLTSLLTKPFVILTGLSGSGKTKLAQAFSSWICENEEDQVCLVPVGADWTNREPLLGYPNALNSGEYVKPDNKVIDLLISASDNPDKPYFLILDEMNLSHVERYFADFLSTMESGKSIPLHTGPEEWGDVPPSISLPSNLFIIGTVNVDETTYMFSPKVLDRANVIDFRVSKNEMALFLENPVKPDMEALKAAGAGMAAYFVRIAKEDTPVSPQKDNVNKVLVSFFEELNKVGAEFGYRTATEIHRLAALLHKLTEDDGQAWEADQIIDAAIIQKLLPKVHGSRSKLVPVLTALAECCLAEGAAEGLLKSFEEGSAEISTSDQVRFKQSLEKILRMKKRVINDGFTSFAEA